MKILFLNQHFGMDSVATGVLLYQLATELSTRHTVTVLAGESAPCEGVRVLRVPCISIGGKGTLRRLAHYFSYFVGALWRGIWVERPDVIVCMSTPPILSLILARGLSLFHHVPFYYNVQDLYPDVAFAAGKLPLGFEPVLRTLAQHLEGLSAGISTVGRRMGTQLGERHQRAVTHLPNWTDTQEIRPLGDEQSLRSVWGLQDRFVVMYSGNLGVCHESELLAATVNLLRDQAIDFLFVVAPAAERELRRLVGDNPRAHFRPYQARAKIAALLATCDVGLVSVRHGMSRFVVPCKAYGIMAAGKPLLVSSDAGDDLYNLVNDEACGLWAPAGDPGALARAVLRLQGDAALRERLGASGRAAAVARYSAPQAARRFERWWEAEAA